MQLEGRVAIVTGGGYGIGKAIALAFAQEGADVVVAARTESALKKVAKEIESMGRKSLAVVIDLLQPDAPAAMVEKTLKKFGKIDILANNAGIIRRAPALDFSETDWDDVLQINLKAVFFLAQAAALLQASRCRDRDADTLVAWRQPPF